MKKLLFIMTFSALMAGCGGDEMPVAVLPEIDTSNPLLAEWTTPHATPPFNDIKIEHYEPAIETAIAVSRAEIDAIVNNPAEPTFKNTIVAMERQGALLNRIMGLFYNLREADTSDEMDAIALRIQPKLTALSNDVSLNPQLFERVKAVYEGSRRGLSHVDVKLLEDTYKSFSRSGAALADDKKEEYRKYTSELSEATLVFGQNALGATNAFAINITNEAQVAELPDFVKEGLAAEAKARGEKGWTVTLKAPSYGPFMTYSSQRDIKEKLYRAYNSRAMGGEFDNSQIIRNITALRMKIANLLGYDTHADFTLEERMAESADNVNSFLSELRTSTLDYGRKDYAMINEYAQSKGHKGDVMPWDWAYYTEKYKSEKYAIDDEQVKPYLQLDNVIKGVFLLAEKLYGITFKPADNIQVYHPEVKAYEVYDKKDLLAVLYLDFFPRASKSSGAWMTEFRGAKVVDGKETRPLVSLVMNFTKPTETTPSLLTFDEFTTFLHEFGHALHGMLAKGEYESLNGTSVYRDFVELPSQIMENWATEKEYLDLWAVHYQTGEPIPAELVEKIVAAKNYLAAYSNLRQLSFGMSDMAWHTMTTPYEGEIEPFEVAAMAPVQITPVVAGTAMAPSFTHIFSGGYAAGYYGYKWAEVLAADAYSLFKEKGIFDKKTASSFRRLLEQGGQRHPMDLYVEFRGHKPETQALVESMGLK
ncbi:MAG: M3 family metallopeptidase [Alistipes sp.]|nr:M3 family metallopeptidase [Alistipes sp.]MBO5399307.1 M3 family metallopeptidase [Alistipes sp.]MBP3474115.1 M3 family metallopeptidase [Alistipes sp.]MBR3792957.1 M3 family metallopeptidase [Alistipes sp.]MBR7115839.1 M3 family metallopeptidase [Alistipes sp.]